MYKSFVDRYIWERGGEGLLRSLRALDSTLESSLKGHLKGDNKK